MFDRSRWARRVLACVSLVSAGACGTSPKLVPASRTTGATPEAPTVAERIARVEHGLLPPVRIARETAPWSLEERMRAHRVPGLVVAVIDDFRLAWTKAYGVADANSGERLTETTPMQSGSISKSIAAFIALGEVRAGKLALDTDINASLKSWKLPPNELTRRTPVTLRQLLSHTAGTTVPGFNGYAFDDAVPTLLQVLDGRPPANSPPVVVDLAPGSRFRYSGGGVSIAQQAVLDAEGGRSYASIAKERVFEPFGMARSTYVQPLPTDRGLYATGHMRDRVIPGKRHMFAELASGGLWTTAGDLAIFWLEIQRALAGRPSHVPAEIATWMTTSVAPVRQDEDVAMGTFLSRHGNAQYFGNWGTNEGFQAISTVRKGKGYGVVLMSNCVGSQRLMQEVLRAIAHEYAWDGYDEPALERRPLDATRLAPFAGRWTFGARDGFDLDLSGGRMALRRPFEDSEELVPIDGDIFVGRDTGVRITFPNDHEAVMTSEGGRVEHAVRLASDAAAPIFLLEANRVDEAIGAYRKLLAVDANEPAASESHLGGMASNLLRLRQDEGALRIMRLDVALHPESTDAHEDLAYVYDCMGRHPDAIVEYRAAMAAMNRNPKASAETKAAYATRMGARIRRP
ncbi:beta-lactamase family protein [Pendulispora rubella]|uniref:Beta-lactamase family protein n=1 Tax=Pendulispora rubella TaxID=2741070 RepID=A0ABZ2L1X4_9BACT